MHDESVPKTISVLFVCLGNICRSPMAEGVFRSLALAQGVANRFHFASAGTGGWHAGDPPDHRSIAAAARNGVDISHQRGRKLAPGDFQGFDHIMGMDRDNVANITRMGSGPAAISLFMQACTGRRQDVPDPYYGTEADFEMVYRMVRAAADSWFGAVDNRVRA